VRTLTRYFAARYLGSFAAILVTTVLTISVIELLLGYGDVFDGGSGLSGLLTYVFLRVPSYYLRDLIPIAAFVAALLTVGLAVRWLEVTAAESAGIPPHRLAWPLLASSVLLAALSFGLSETLVTTATASWNEQQRAADEQAIVFRRGAFWYHKGHSIYNIVSADPETNTLRGIEIFQRTPRGRLLADIRADRARVSPEGVWHIENATIRRFDPAHPEQPTRIETGVDMDLEVSKSRAVLLRQADAASLRLPELAEYLATHAGDDFPGSRATAERLRTLLHRRAGEPLLVIVFTLLAIPLALRAQPGSSLGVASVYAIATLGAFFLLRSIAESLAAEQLVPGPLMVWSVLGVFAVYGAFDLWRTAR
jgi:LPS export ABC transporter permease LptG